MAFNRPTPAASGKAPRKRPRQSTSAIGDPPSYSPAPELKVSELNLFQKLAVLQEWVGGMKKSGHYEQGRTNYWYHKHEDIMDALRPRLAALGIDATVEIPESEVTIVKGRVDQDTGVAKEGFRAIIRLQITLTNADNPLDHKTYSLRMAGLDYGDKDHTKAGTLALKYFWVWKLNLGDAESDADAQNVDESGVTTGPADSTKPATAAPEGITDEDWDRIGALAQTIGWGPKKVKARIVHHGGEREGYVKTLAELFDDHAKAHGPDCVHVQKAIGVVKADEPAQEVQEPVQGTLVGS